MAPIHALAAVLCFVVGISLGLLGAGGSVLMVPIFVYVAKLSAAAAIALSLLVVGLSSIVGSIKYIRQGSVNTRLVMLFVVPGMAASFFGAQTAKYVSSGTLLFLFGILMAVIAVILYIKSSKQSPIQGIVICRPNFFLSTAVGSVIGFLTGLLGVGGGFLIVPAIALLMRCSMPTAIGTSLAIIAVNSMSGFIGHLPVVGISAPLGALFLTATIAGAFMGTKISDRFNVLFIQKGFALLILTVGCFLAAQHFPFHAGGNP